MYRILLTSIVTFYALISIIGSHRKVYQKRITDTSAEQKAAYYLKELQVYFNNGDYDKHKMYSDSLLYISKKHNLTKFHITALTNQAIFYKNRGDRLKAIELYHNALKQCENIPDDFKTKVVVLVNMGNIYNDIGYYDKAVSKMKQVIKLLDTYENSDKIRAAALMGLSESYKNLKAYDSTLVYAKKSRDILEKTDNEAFFISAVNSVSEIHIIQKNYKKAIEESVIISKLDLLKKPTKSRAVYLLNLGISHYYLNNLDKALENLKACKVLSKRKKIVDIEMYAHEYLAKLYEQKGDYKQSIAEQKAYVKIRNAYLKDQKEASNADLNTEINLKSEILKKNEKELYNAREKRNAMLLVSITILIVLVTIVFFFIKRKNRLAKEQELLQAQHLELQKNYNTILENAKIDASKDRSNESADLKPYKNSSLTEEKRRALKEQILDYMSKHKPFLDPEITQARLAENLNISTSHFSEVLHYNMKQNFYNFMNAYRVLEAQHLIKDPKYKDSKILSIAFDSGFKSKTTFNRIFKAHTGYTPTEYKRANI